MVKGLDVILPVGLQVQTPVGVAAEELGTLTPQAERVVAELWLSNIQKRTQKQLAQLVLQLSFVVDQTDFTNSKEPEALHGNSSWHILLNLTLTA